MTPNFFNDSLDKNLFFFIIISLIIHLSIIYIPFDFHFNSEKTIIYSPYKVKLIGGLKISSGTGKTKNTVKKSVPAKRKTSPIKTTPQTTKTKAKVSLNTKKKKKTVKKKSKIIKKSKATDNDDDFNLKDFKKFLDKKKKEKGSTQKADTGNSGINGTGQSSVEAAKGLDILQKVYYNDIIEIIKSSWILPPQLKREKRNLKVVLVIKIDKNGKIIGSHIEQSSGNEFYDQSALRTISKIRKFNAPPVIKGRFLDIGLIFNLKELQ